MKEVLLKVWYVILAIVTVLAYFNRDYVLQGDLGGDFSNWFSNVFDKRERAMVKKIDCEKKKFVVVTDDGKVLVPERMLNTFKTDGLNVWVSYDVTQDVDTICEVGTQVTISKMKKL